MRAEVISIGDELTSGQTLDTNGQWISQRLEDLGVRVLFHTTVGDDLEANVAVFRTAVGRADIIIATGGLGPTADDLTRDALAKMLGRKLIQNETALAHIRALFARRKREMPPSNQVQARLPEGSTMIDNPHGTAPGIAIEVPRETNGVAHIFCLPGVPAEMRQMWEESVRSSLHRLGAGRRVIRHRRIKCFGAGESAIEAMLPDLVRRGCQPRVGITASKTTITLRITAEGNCEAACFAAMEPTVATIRQCLGSLIFGEGDDELQHTVVRMLHEHRKTLATVEWGTDGLVSQWFREVGDAVPEVPGSVVLENENAWAGLFEMPTAMTTPPSGEYADVVKLAAQECRRRFRTDFGLAVVRSDSPSSSSEASDTAMFALATPEEIKFLSMPVASHPSLLKIFCAKNALNFVRLALLELENPA